MSDIKIIFEDDNWIEYEFTQPNDLLGDTTYWDEEDHKKWNEKMKDLEQQGIKGQDETFTVKFQKNPFTNGAGFTREVAD